MKVYREITPLKSDEVFVLSDYHEASFNYPLHNHPEYELCLTLGSAGNRIVGDSIAKYNYADLVLIGPHIYHRWDNTDIPNSQRKKARVLVLQFDSQLLSSSLLSKNSFHPIRMLLTRSLRGIEFRGKTRDLIIERLEQLVTMKGLDSVLEFLSILDQLAHAPEQQLLASEGFSFKPENTRSRRINEVYEFIMKNYTDKIQVGHAAEIANMSESAFSHFFKKCTNKSFTQFVVELRIGLACKLLLETRDTVSQVCFQCGFNNVSNFNRLFKKYKKLTPHQFRRQIEGSYLNINDRFV